MFKQIKQIKKADEYVGKLKEIIALEQTESDLDGMLTSIVFDISQDESLLDFETRLSRAKASDLQ